MPRRYLCAGGCGNLMWHGTGSLPPGEATCLACRRARPTAGKNTNPGRKTPCVSCGEPSWGERCRPCNTQARQAVALPGNRRDRSRQRRHERDRTAPGLGQAARYRLRDKWIKQGRRCAYCPSLANTVDHVVPLSKGGTNYEGNLVPCCSSCNWAKSDLLLSEWRHGKRLPKWRTEIKLRPRVPRERREPVAKFCKVYFGTCSDCEQAFSSRSAMSTRCAEHRGYPRSTERPCTMCGAIMTCKQGGRRYCSTACQRSSPTYKANRKRHREKWKQTPHGRESMRRAKRKQKAKASQRARQLETLF